MNGKILIPILLDNKLIVFLDKESNKFYAMNQNGLAEQCHNVELQPLQQATPIESETLNKIKDIKAKYS